MSEEIVVTKLLELRNTKDLQRKKELATEISNITSDQELKKEMEDYLKFHEAFHLT